MSLKPGSDRETREENIREMVRSGYPRKRAVAAAFRNAREHDPSKDDEAKEAAHMKKC